MKAKAEERRRRRRRRRRSVGGQLYIHNEGY
jgi:hypothetical protein